MKKERFSPRPAAPALALGLLLSLASCPGLFGQSYQIHPSHFPAGGGSGSSGIHQVRGAFGAMPAGQSTAGSYSLKGGFWSLLGAVNTPGAPALTISRSGNFVIVSWPASATGFTLQISRNLNPTPSWDTLTNPTQTRQGMVSITLPLERGHRFFRLVKPKP